MADKLPSHVLDEIYKGGEYGFRAFYTLVSANREGGYSPPKHVDVAIKQLYEAKANSDLPREAFMWWAARGFTKSYLGHLFSVYELSLDPTGSLLVIRSNDDWSRESARFILGMIENDVAYRQIFPHIFPDTDKAWGVTAAWIKVGETFMSQEKWQLAIGNRIDPSISCESYDSKNVRGKHPATVLYVDDLHDINNVFSERGLENTKQIVTSTILNTRQPNNPFELWTCTPWHESDTYHMRLDGGNINHLVTPVADKWPDGVPTWDRFPEEAIAAALKMDHTGGLLFRREMMCDVSSEEASEMPYQEYPHELIEYSWPAWAGVDFASIPEPGQRSQHRSHASICRIMKLPNGTAVIEGGELGQWSQGETEENMLKVQIMFRNFQFGGFETLGKGEIFFETFMARNPDARYMPVNPPSVKKIQRIVSEFAPHLRNGSLMVSDKRTPFLDAARRFMRTFPITPHKGDSAWDVMDSIYNCWKAMQGEFLSPFKKESKKRGGGSPWRHMGDGSARISERERRIASDARLPFNIVRENESAERVH